MKFWIMGSLDDKDLLIEIGLKLGQYNYHLAQWDNVEVSDPQLELLDKYWGTFMWGPANLNLIDTLVPANTLLH